MKKPGVWIAVAAVAFVVFLAYSTLNQRQYRVEVCMEFQGHEACRTASAETEQQAVRTATDNACALVSSGMTDSMACGRTPPKSVRWLSGR